MVGAMSRPGVELAGWTWRKGSGMKATHSVEALRAIAAFCVFVAGVTSAQEIVMPTKITTEAVLEQANDQMVRCGINWANLLAQGNSILAYQIETT